MIEMRRPSLPKERPSSGPVADGPIAEIASSVRFILLLFTHIMRKGSGMCHQKSRTIVLSFSHVPACTFFTYL